jgi:hypothetical protein
MLRDEITIRQVLITCAFRATCRDGDQYPAPCPVHRVTTPQRRAVLVNRNADRHYGGTRLSHGTAFGPYVARNKTRVYMTVFDPRQAVR